MSINGLGDEGAADRGDALQETLGDEAVEGCRTRHPGDAELLDEVALGRRPGCRARRRRSAERTYSRTSRVLAPPLGCRNTCVSHN